MRWADNQYTQIIVSTDELCKFHDESFDMILEIVVRENCYKLMLLTGSKQESIVNFYRKAGITMNLSQPLFSGFRSL